MKDTIEEKDRNTSVITEGLACSLAPRAWINFTCIMCTLSERISPFVEYMRELHYHFTSICVPLCF